MINKVNWDSLIINREDFIISMRVDITLIHWEDIILFRQGRSNRHRAVIGLLIPFNARKLLILVHVDLER